ncbi:MAG: hypothetical protein ACLTMP_04865 [Eggerthella lenta]
MVGSLRAPCSWDLGAGRRRSRDGWRAPLRGLGGHGHVLERREGKRVKEIFARRARRLPRHRDDERRELAGKEPLLVVRRRRGEAR